MHADTIRLLTPEIVLVAVAAAIYLGGTFVAAPGLWRWLAGGAIAAAAVALWRVGPVATLGGPLLVDPLAAYGRALALALGGVLLLLNWRPTCAGGAAERLGTLLLAIAGLMLTSIAGDLVLLFVSLEMISIPTYILLYMGRRDAACQESAAKYFFLSILASAIFLYGLSFLYGTTGATDLGAIRRARRSGGRAQGVCPAGRRGVGDAFRRAEFPHHRRAVSLLRPRRISRRDPCQRRVSLRLAEGRRPDCLGAADAGNNARQRTLRLAHRPGAGRRLDDCRQRGWPCGRTTCGG